MSRKKAIPLNLVDALNIVENWSDSKEVIDICKLPPERDSVTDEEEIDKDDIAN